MRIFLFVILGLAGSALAAEPAAPWWAIFHDPALDRLESAAIQANQDLRQAVARVTEAREQALIAAAAFYPQLTAPLHAVRERTTNTGPVVRSRIVGGGFPFPVGAGIAVPNSFAGQQLTTTFDDFQAQLSLSYEVDLFGRVRHAVSEARANALATLAERQAIELSLTAQVARNYFLLRALDAQTSVLQRTVRLRNDSVTIQKQRAQAGAASDLDSARAELELANTEADLSDVIRERGHLQNALAVLTGESAGDFRVLYSPLNSTQPPAVPARIPADLLRRRPDLAEAERRLRAAAEGIQTARIAGFPTISLQGNYGYESAQFDQLFEDQSHVWTVSAAVNVPLFEGGRITAGLREARARREEAFSAYRQATLTAFEEAENALVDLRQRNTQAEARTRAAFQAQRVFESSQRRYLEGAVNYFEVIDAQRVLLGAQLSEVQTLNARYAATIDLIRALGGGYGR